MSSPSWNPCYQTALRSFLQVAIFLKGPTRIVNTMIIFILTKQNLLAKMRQSRMVMVSWGEKVKLSQLCEASSTIRKVPGIFFVTRKPNLLQNNSFGSILCIIFASYLRVAKEYYVKQVWVSRMLQEEPGEVFTQIGKKKIIEKIVWGRVYLIE